ncbi:MAG: hypothetical protein IJV06_09095 [Bacteroidaceae bacterium]|nr:hypothetical protein [Bacteroidaceae bacterium]
MKRMMFLLTAGLLLMASAVMAEDWNHITASGLYYYGEGTGETEAEAGSVALDNLLQMISVNVTSDFSSIYDGVSENGQLSHKESVRQCVQTYSTSALTNVQTWVVSKAPQAVVRKYMKRAELEKMYEERIGRLKDMAAQADAALGRGNVDVALQYYYWAYTLLRSLQFPNRVKDGQGRVLINTLPQTIASILKDIKVEFAGREGDDVDLFFTYQGKPATVDFTYNDGRKDGCDGKADGGKAYIEMAQGYAADGVYHVNIEYEYKNWARGDAEMQSVLSVIPRRAFGGEFVVRAKEDRKQGGVRQDRAQQHGQVAVKSAPSNEHELTEPNVYAEKVNMVLDALKTRQYERAMGCFTDRGRDNFTRLVRQRNGRLVGTPSPKLYTAPSGCVMVRGIQMSFSVTERGHKTTLVDDVVLTFDKNKQICNLTFGIGSIAEGDLLNKNVSWGEDTRQLVLDFLENYKTAYCLKDSSYIESIFDDNATIIVGNVAKRTTRPGIAENQLSDLGRDIITYKKYTKAEYLKNLRRTFDRNQFINIKFTNNDVQLLENEQGQVFSIQIGQEYSSSTYADQGYLFLMVDMTNKAEPLIKIRTWQPKPDPEFGLYGPGHFYK